MKRLVYLFFVVALIQTAVCKASGSGSDKKANSTNETESSIIEHVPYGMVNISALHGTDKLVIELNSFSKTDRIVEFFNHEGNSLGVVTIWAYNKQRTFISTLSEGSYTYHLKDGENTWKGNLVIIN